MPEFTSLAEADAWRAVHAPARKPRETSQKNGSEGGKKNGGSSGTTTPQDRTGKGGPDEGDNYGLSDDASRDPSAAENRARARQGLGMRPGDTAPPERIDVDKFVDKQADFIELTLVQAKEVPQIAHGLLKRAMGKGEPGAIAAATKNWHEAAGHAADVLQRFIEIQRESGSLLTIDDVADVVLTELQEVRKNLRHLGRRHAATANPADPALAQRIFDQAIDLALPEGLGEAIVERVKVELDATAAAEAAAAIASPLPAVASPIPAAAAP